MDILEDGDADLGMMAPTFAFAMDSPPLSGVSSFQCIYDLIFQPRDGSLDMDFLPPAGAMREMKTEKSIDMWKANGIL